MKLACAPPIHATLHNFGKLAPRYAGLPGRHPSRGKPCRIASRRHGATLMSSSVTSQAMEIRNYYGGAWHKSAAADFLDVTNPATGEPIARTPLSTTADVDAAVQAAAGAFPAWRRTPPGERIQYLFKLKFLLEDHIDEIARLITLENGKTFAEAKAEIRRGIENVEVACGIPIMMQGYNLEDITPGVDETLLRQPLGVVAAVTPFNFPAMIPLWFLPYAIACGNTVLLKPSEKVPMTAVKFVRLLEETGLPPGVVNLVHGGREAVDALVDHPVVRAISFVGSSPVARHVYSRAAASGKRAQCQGGAKNPVIVLPDADMEMTGAIVAEHRGLGQRDLVADPLQRHVVDPEITGRHQSQRRPRLLLLLDLAHIGELGPAKRCVFV